MENQHRRQLQNKFGDLLVHKTLINLDIPDDYQYMDPELVELLKSTVSEFLEGQW